jgi:hypothetical protein
MEDERIVRWDEALVRDFLIPAAQSIVVDKLVGEEHDICIHAILLRKLDHRMWVSFRKLTKQRYVQAAFSRLAVADL